MGAKRHAVTDSAVRPRAEEPAVRVLYAEHGEELGELLRRYFVRLKDR